MPSKRLQSHAGVMTQKCRVIILILSFFTVLMCVSAKYDDCVSKITALKSMTSSPTKIQKLSGQAGRILAVHLPVTCDGYVITLFRLTFGNNEPAPTKSPVLLAHGMFQSSDRFLEQTPDKSLAYKLQDLGFDVWLFNARGNKYSRRNINMESECDEKVHFFDYSYEEIGLRDLAVTVDYMLSVTRFKKIQFVGHSLGGTFFLVLNSLRPEYNALFDNAFLLAPFAYHRKFPHGSLKYALAHTFEPVTPKELLNNDVVEIFPYKCIRSQEYKFAPEDCLQQDKYKDICKYLDLQTVMGLNSNQNTIFDTRGGSIKQLEHFAQNVVSGVFRRYQFPEALNNTKNYGEKYSPEYDLSQITVPTKIYYSKTDEYINHEDIAELAKKMVNATTVEVAKMNFNHNDFVNSTDATYYVYTSIIRALPENPGPKRPKHLVDRGRFIEWNNRNKNLLVCSIIGIVGIAISVCLCISIVSWMTAQ